MPSLRSLKYLLAWTVGFLLFAATSPAQSVPGPQEYFPSGTEYDAKVPTPESVLGWQVGEWHVRHDQLLAYMHRLADATPRVRLDAIGHTHERRQLVQLVISSPENLNRLDEILDAQQRLSDGTSEDVDIDDLPIVVNLGYSVHGNEASGSNASLLVAYYLAAAHGLEIERWLDEAIIVLDPSLNPDGLARFAQWANMHKGQQLVADPRHREHREGWPNGRTNHYWFDLNRDWLLAQHPETRARLQRFHQFQPTVLGDFHEMGTGSTYFFQPGIPSRRNPLTPERNVELTQAIANFHAQALDDIGSLYYSEESFDDFYYGKGSTYPDIHGSIGILFEQASVRGHLQESSNGPLTFPFAIRNQVRTSLSTIRGAVAKRRDLLQYRRDFFRQSLDLAGQDAQRGWVFGDAKDPARTFHMVELLRRHQIEVHHLAKDVTLGEQEFKADQAWVITNQQRQYRLLKSLFEQRVDFPDTAFYDVSTWTLPLAFDMPFAAVSGGLDGLLGEAVATPSFPAVDAVTAHPPSQSPRPYAYVFAWDNFYAPRALGRVLQRKLRARVATRGFTIETRQGPRSFAPGAVVIPARQQNPNGEVMRSVLDEIARRDGVTVHAVDTGLASEGVDLGSPSLHPVEAPRLAMLVGRGVDTYDAGELWHLLDQRFEMPVTLLDLADVDGAQWSRYSHLVMADGDYGRLSEKAGAEINRWVRQGGTLITIRRATTWAEDHVLKVDRKQPEAAQSPTPKPQKDAEAKAPKHKPVFRLPYAEARPRWAEQLISGTAFAVDLDLTHPLAFGYADEELAVFRNHKVHLTPTGNPYSVVAAYQSAPLLSGFVSGKNLDRLSGTPAVIAETRGDGTIIRIADSPSFRAYWYGTNKLMLNAIYFGPILPSNNRP